MTGPSKIGRIRKVNGIAGNFLLTVLVWYPGETKPYRVAFHGSTYGSPGPIVMVSETGQEFVRDAGKYGAKLDESWVRKFYGMDE